MHDLLLLLLLLLLRLVVVVVVVVVSTDSVAVQSPGGVWQWAAERAASVVGEWREDSTDGHGTEGLPRIGHPAGHPG